MREQRLAAIASEEALHAEVTQRPNGVHVDGDAILRDLAEGHDDEQPEAGMIETEDRMAIRRPKSERELSPAELKAQRLAALADLKVLHQRILARRGGVPIDVDAVLRELREGVDCDE